MFFFFKKSTTNKNTFWKRGESFTETMISIFILTSGLVAAGGLIMAAINTAGNIKEKIIAINLAREGIETVRNVRDTNWLKYSANLRECWNWQETNGSCSEAIGNGAYNINKLIQPGFYTIDFDGNNYKWILDNYVSKANWANTNWETTVLKNNLAGFYTHSGNRKTQYQRRIEIKYLADNGSETTDVNVNRWEIISTVRYTHGSQLHQVALITHISDYFNRENHAN